jgi:hypothetical protein
MFDAFLSSKKFQEALKAAALEALKTPEGQKLLGEAIRRELRKMQKKRNRLLQNRNTCKRSRHSWQGMCEGGGLGAPTR